MVTGRIAPTPSGFLHEGNAFNFILTYLIIRKYNGRLRLRIDDLDAERTNDLYLHDIFETLHWLGIDYDEGPETPTQHLQEFSQQHRIPEYQKWINQLLHSGLLFACSCSRSQLAAGHVCTCSELPMELNRNDVALKMKAGSPVSWHDVILGEQLTPFPPTVIRRRDGIPAYQIASLYDDLLYGVDTLVRGEDLVTSTAIQIQLARYLNKPSFLQCRFFHHPLITDMEGIKLSKSGGACSIKELRKFNKDVAYFYRKISPRFACEPVNSLKELFDQFDLNRMVTSMTQ